MNQINRAKVRRRTRKRLLGRDLEVLKFIVGNRFATGQAIGERFWKNGGNRNQYRRLRSMEKLGCIEPLLGDRGIRLGYRPTRKGVRYLKKLGIEAKTDGVRGKSYRSTYEHDEILLRLRRIIESTPLASHYRAEHEVASALGKKYGFQDRGEHTYKIPDAIFELRTARGIYRVALELEIARKSRARYRRMFKRLLLSKDWDVVLLIVQDDLVLAVMKIIVDEIKAQDLEIRIAQKTCGLYFGRLDQFLAEGVKCPFEGEGKVFSFQSLQEELASAVPQSGQDRSDDPIRHMEAPPT